MAVRPKTELGIFAERYAADYLSNKGYKIIGRNYRKPWGEIDLVAFKEGILIFVEVKANKKDLPGFEPELRVDRHKQHRMVRIAQTYLSDHHYSSDQPWQLDVVSFALTPDRKNAKIRHYKNI